MLLALPRWSPVPRGFQALRLLRRFERILLAAGLPLVVLWHAGTAAAQGQLAMRWTVCSPDGPANTTTSCQSDVETRDLVLSFVPDARVTDVVGWRLVLDYVSDAPVLPAWWQVQGGGCRDGQIAAIAPTTQAGGCEDPWSASGSSIVQSVFYPRPGGDGAQLRLVAVAGVPAVDAFALEAGTPYLATVLQVHFAHTVTGTCPGCSTPVCFVFNSAELVRLQGAGGIDPGPLVDPSPDGNQCTWMGGASCTPVPARGRTWGQLKALYR